MAALLLAILLLLVQVVLAAHQIEHLTEPGSEQDCPLCLAGQSLDQAGPPSECLPALSAPGPIALLSFLPAAPSRLDTPYQVRAPPPPRTAV